MRHEHMYPDAPMGVNSGHRMDKYTYNLYMERIEKMRHIETIYCRLIFCDPGYTPWTFCKKTKPETPDWYHYDAYALCATERSGQEKPSLVIWFPSMGTMLEPSRYEEIAHVPKYCMRKLEGRYSYWKSSLELGRMVIEKAYKERGLEDELKRKHGKWFNSLLGLATLGREVAPIPEPYEKRLHLQRRYYPYVWDDRGIPDSVIHAWIRAF